MQRLFLLSVVFVGSLGLSAQLPSTQLFVFDYVVRDTALMLSKPLYLTAFNAEGYNNQPAWVNRDVLLASIQKVGQAQPDAYKLDLARREITRLTATEAGEYSPKPRNAGKSFTAVRQEYSARDTVIRLWEFPLDLSSNGQLVFPTMNDVGYYEWLNSVQAAVFQVRNPVALGIASTDTESVQALAIRTGRCFQRQPDGNLAYVDKSATPWRLVEKNLYRLDQAPALIAEMPDGVEDFAILRDGTFLIGRGPKLYRFDPIDAPRWIEITDLRLYGIRAISRLAVNSFGRLALVAETNAR